MIAAHRGVPARTFTRPKGIEKIHVCLEGMQSTGRCRHPTEDIVIAHTAYLRVEPTIQFSSTPHQSNGNTEEEMRQPTTVSHAQNITPTLKVLHFLQSPEDGGTYRLNPQLPEEEQMLPIEVHVPRGSQVTFWADGRTLGVMDTSPFRIWWPLREGYHRIRVDIRLPNGSIVVEHATFTVTK